MGIVSVIAAKDNGVKPKVAFTSTPWAILFYTASKSPTFAASKKRREPAPSAAALPKNK